MEIYPRDHFPSGKKLLEDYHEDQFWNPRFNLSIQSAAELAGKGTFPCLAGTCVIIYRNSDQWRAMLKESNH